MDYRIYQIYYDDQSENNCYLHPCVQWIRNDNHTDFFENEIILQLRGQMRGYDYFGVWSHRHKFKVQGQVFTFEKLESRLNVDVVAFQRLLHNGRIFSGQWEREYKKMFNYLMIRLGLSYRFPQVPKFVVMQNHFITRGRIYADYVDTVLKPAIELIKDMKESLEKVKYKDGSYNYRPFLCEKLFSAYLHDKNLKCEQW